MTFFQACRALFPHLIKYSCGRVLYLQVTAPKAVYNFTTSCRNMAHNKEYAVLVLDVRRSVSEDFKQKSVKCCSDIIKQKICTGKKDYMSFVLVGTRDTDNDMNADAGGHDNVTQYEGELQVPSWKLLMSFYQFVNATASHKGEWLDALMVAFGVLMKGVKSAKMQRRRVILFYDFNDETNSYDSFEDITRAFLENEIELIVISENIKFIDNAANDNLPQAMFQSPNSSPQRLDNEKHALRLVTDCNAKLCNFTEAISTVLQVKNKNPWSWKAKLRIGSKICINIIGIIAAKNESTIKLKKVWNNPDEELEKKLGYFIDGNQVRPDVEELMDGYMMGGTPFAYDESEDSDKKKFPTGLTFFGFIQRKLLYDEYFSGSSTYLILHQRGMTASAKMLDALVRVLLDMDYVMLCWKVYSEKFSKPHFVVLIPNKIEDDCPATFSMIELAHHEQYHYFEFPKLKTKQTECSKEQLDAIDLLIDNMDLTLKGDDATKPRETFHKDLLRFDKLPHIFHRNFIDVMERKILSRASEDDEQFLEMLKDKNFVEAFWKLDEKIEEGAKSAIEEVKKVFSLNINDKWRKQSNAEEPSMQKLKSEDSGESTNNKNIVLNFDSVRSATPAEDFEMLLQAHVFTISDSTQRDVKFNHYAGQLRTVLKNLILKANSNMPPDFAKISAALTAYRKRCFTFNTYEDYNSWICSIKNEVLNRRMVCFWNEVIVKHELGLCFIGVPSLDEQIKERDFYCLEFIDATEQQTPGQMEVDDIMANMPTGK